MFVKGLRKFLYAGALLALAPIMARAQEPKKAEAIGAPATTAPAAAAPAATAPCPPATCRVKVLECFDEPYEYTRCIKVPVTRQECYTAYRCETVSETKTKQVTVYEKVCETVNETRCVVKKVPCWEERTEYVTKCKAVQCTEMVAKTHYHTHWECCEVPASPGLFSHKSSCDPCNPCGGCCTPCTKTVKKLVVDKCTTCEPVCRTKLVKECVPVCKKVCTYKCVTETCVVPVTKVKCVPVCKTVTYTECKKVQIPYQATRCVTTCETKTEVCKGVHKVAKWVEKEVPAAPCCDTCATSCCGKSLFGGLKGRFASKSCCGSSCGVAASCSSCCH